MDADTGRIIQVLRSQGVGGPPSALKAASDGTVGAQVGGSSGALTLGFYGATPVAQQGNTGADVLAVIASLLATAAGTGLVVDDSTPLAAVSVTGSQVSGAALTSLLAALVQLGLIVDNTTT